MCDTLAKLVSDLMAGLGLPPEEWLPAEEAVRACTASLLFAEQSLTQSNQNQIISKKTFTPSAREHSLTDVQGVPVWCERQVGTAADPVWRYIPAVNLASIDEAAERGDDRCAFFSENEQLRVRFSYLPSGSQEHRLRYDPNPLLEQTVNDPLRVPAGFYPLYAARAKRIVIPVMLAYAAKDPENEPTEFQLLAWQTALEEAERTLGEWKPLWEQHRLGSRGSARGRRRRPVLAR